MKKKKRYLKTKLVLRCPQCKKKIFIGAERFSGNCTLSCDREMFKES